MKYITTVDGQEYVLEILDDQRLLINDQEYDIDFESLSGQPVYSLLINGRSFEGLVYASENEWEVLLHGTLYNIQVEDERERRLRVAAGGAATEQREFHLKAPMPGLVVSVPVAEGQEIEKGEVLVILESMKMQNELKSPRSGRVTRLRVNSGDSVDQRDTLLTVE